MRFFLDECVPKGVATTLRRRKHWCRTVQEARRSSGRDLDHAGYAESIDAIFVSGDKVFYRSRLSSVYKRFGIHVLLDCPKPEMRGLLERHIDTLVEMISEFGECLYKVDHEDGVTFEARSS